MNDGFFTIKTTTTNFQCGHSSMVKQGKSKNRLMANTPDEIFDILVPLDSNFNTTANCYPEKYCSAPSTYNLNSLSNCHLVTQPNKTVLDITMQFELY